MTAKTNGFSFQVKRKWVYATNFKNRSNNIAAFFFTFSKKVNNATATYRVSKKITEKNLLFGTNIIFNEV